MARPMTQQGYDAILAEIEFLWHTERPHIVEQVHAAAELGDRSENAEYIYGKKRLREIDSRLRYLKRKVAQATPVDLAGIPHSDRIKFGARVTVEDEEGEQKIWRLVDKEESDPKRGWISVQSPVGRALMGKSEGDVATVRLPKGVAEYEIVAVEYRGEE